MTQDAHPGQKNIIPLSIGTRFITFYIISFLEGSAVMACELTGAKLIAPYYGNSLYVWSSVLGTTLGGLAAGYYLGGRISEKLHVRKYLFFILLIASLLMLFTPSLSSFIMSATLNLSIQMGSLISCMVFIFPTLLCFGMVSPIIIRIVSTDVGEVGNKTGTIYAISTIGGLIMTFSMGFYFIPMLGLKMCCYITATLLAISTLLSLFSFNVKNSESENKSVVEESPDKPIELQKQHSDSIYLIAAFCEGAAVIAVELLGAKMISPYYGTSLAVWTAVIGITIGFLTVGYFIGGLLASKKNLLRVISYALALASFFIVIMPLFSRQLFLLTQNMTIYSGCTVVAALLLGPPLLCLGATTPLIIQQLTRQVQLAGKNAGKVYAISTIGGILFTFLIGFFIIPEFGISKPLMALSFVLLALSAFLYFELKQVAVIVLVIAVTGYSLFGDAAGKNSGYYNLLYESEGIMGQLKVLENKNPGKELQHHYMLVNGIANTNAVHDPKLNLDYSYWSYVHKIAMVASLKRDSKNALILGFGGGNIATELQNLNMNVDAVDIDGRVLHVAKNYFNFKDSNFTFIADDARHFIRTAKKKYDLIVFDVLNAEVQPSYVFTSESLTELKGLLNDDGMVIIEFQEHEKTSGNYIYQSICNTLLSLGYKTYFDDEGSDMSILSDIIIVASLKDIDNSKYRIENLTPCCRDKDWAIEFLKRAYIKCEQPFARGVIFTDDKPLIDILNADVIKQWRISANSMYGNGMLKSGQRLFK